jgi:hypothetical protein
VRLQLNNISYEILSPGFDPSLAKYQRASCVIIALMRSSGQNENMLMCPFLHCENSVASVPPNGWKTYQFLYFVPWNRTETVGTVVSSSASYSISNLTPQTYPASYYLGTSPTLLANTDHLSSNIGKTSSKSFLTYFLNVLTICHWRLADNKVSLNKSRNEILHSSEKNSPSEAIKIGLESAKKFAAFLEYTVHCSSHKSPPIVPVLSHTNPVHTLPF